MRLMDWLEEHVPVEPIRLLALIDQILILLRMRRDCVTACMFGIVCPQLFIVDHQDRVRLLDLADESNSAVSRKIQSGSVTRFFAPYGMMDSADAQTEIYGVGRLCQYMLSENEEAGAVLTGPLRRPSRRTGRRSERSGRRWRLPAGKSRESTVRRKS